MKTIYLLIFSLIILQCRKDDINYTKTEDKSKAKVLVEKTVFVRALDEENNILTRSRLLYANKKSESDPWGILSMKEFTDKERIQFTVSQAGYFDSYFASAHYTQGNQIHSLKLRKTNFQRSKGNKSTKITTSINNAIQLEASSLITENKIKYSSDFYLEYYDYDLKQQSPSESFPADYLAFDSKGEKQTLIIHNLIQFRIYDIFQNPLNLLKPIEYTCQIQNSSLKVNNDSVEIYKYNENSSYWEFDSRAYVNNNMVYCKLNHSGSYACASPNSYIEIEGQTDKINGISIPQGQIQIYTSSNELIKTIQWNEEGQWFACLAKNQDYLLRIEDCNKNNIYTNSLSTNTILPSKINIHLNSNDWLILSGKIINCYNKDLSRAYIMNLRNDNPIFSLTDSFGNFSIAYSSCHQNDLKLLKANIYDGEFSLEAFSYAKEIYSKTPFNCQSGDIYIEYPNKVVRNIDNCAIHSKEIGITKYLEFNSYDKNSGSEYLIRYYFANAIQTERIELSTLGRGTSYFILNNYKSFEISPSIQIGKKLELKITNCTIEDEKGKISNDVIIHCSGTLQ